MVHVMKWCCQFLKESAAEMTVVHQARMLSATHDDTSCKHTCKIMQLHTMMKDENLSSRLHRLLPTNKNRIIVHSASP